MSQEPQGFAADAALRIDAPPTRPRDRGRRALATLVAAALELGVFAVIWSERRPPPPPRLVEIPVEIVQEPPPPPKPSTAPRPPSSQENEKAATEAPRAGKSDHDDEQVAEKEKPTAAPPPPSPPSPPPSPQASAAAPPSPAPAPPSPAPELPQAADAEAPPPVKTELSKTRAASPAPALAALPKAFADVPNVDFGGAAIRAPVSGGNAKATYLSILYGLTVPQIRVPISAHSYGRRLRVVLGMTVDGRGRLTNRYIVESSGSLELDEAVMQAVATASKQFPPPPHNSPAGLTFTFVTE